MLLPLNGLHHVREPSCMIRIRIHSRGLVGYLVCRYITSRYPAVERGANFNVRVIPAVF